MKKSKIGNRLDYSYEEINQENPDDIDVLVFEPTEQGFIMMEKVDNKIYKYVGKNDTYIERFKPLEIHIKHQCLNKLTIFDNDGDGICELISEHRKKGINARMLAVFSYGNSRIIDYDYTNEYFTQQKLPLKNL